MGRECIDQRRLVRSSALSCVERMSHMRRDSLPPLLTGPPTCQHHFRAPPPVTLTPMQLPPRTCGPRRNTVEDLQPLNIPVLKPSRMNSLERRVPIQVLCLLLPPNIRIRSYRLLIFLQVRLVIRSQVWFRKVGIFAL
jgi:hypothetical protein